MRRHVLSQIGTLVLLTAAAIYPVIIAPVMQGPTPREVLVSRPGMPQYPMPHACQAADAMLFIHSQGRLQQAPDGKPGFVKKGAPRPPTHTCAVQGSAIAVLICSSASASW